MNTSKRQIGICTNIGKCDQADMKVRSAITDRESMMCKNCGKPLFVLDDQSGDSKPKFKRNLLLLGAGVLIGFFGLFVLATKDTKNNDVSSVSQPSNGSDDLQKILNSGELRLGVLQNAEPFYFEEGGRPSGFNYEFMQLVAKQAPFAVDGKQLKITIGATTDKYEKVPGLLLEKDREKNFMVDVAMDGLTFSDNDLKGVVYTSPYFGENFGYGVITSKDKKVTSASELSGKTVGVLAEDADVLFAVKSAIPNAKIKTLDSEIFENGKRIWLTHYLNDNTVDAIVYDYPFGSAEIKGTSLEFSLSKIPGSVLKYKIALRDRNPNLKAALNKAIEMVKQTKEFSDLEKKYFFSTQISKPMLSAQNVNYHVVKRGETLSIIADALLGDGKRFKEIEALNNLPNPNFIEVNQKLAIPAK
jgi:ABC-type amino acid transport substrate-binding protein